MPNYGSEKMVQLPYSNISHAYLMSWSGPICPYGFNQTPLELSYASVYFVYPAAFQMWEQWISISYANPNFIIRGVGSQNGYYTTSFLFGLLLIF